MKSPKETALEEKILRQLAAHAFPGQNRKRYL